MIGKANVELRPHVFLGRRPGTVCHFRIVGTVEQPSVYLGNQLTPEEGRAFLASSRALSSASMSASCLSKM